MTRKILVSAGAVLLAAAVAGGASIVRYARQLDDVLAEKFAGRRWDFPSKIYADSVVLYPGADLEVLGLPERLERLRYRETTGAVEYEGEYHLNADALDLHVRQFHSVSGPQPARVVRLTLKGSRVERIVDADSGLDLHALELEPEPLAGLYQSVWEERRVLSLDKVPATLVSAILSTEDQRFFEHGGIDPRGVLRALWVNLSTGRVVQGGSTLTQQLMKNFFLSEDRNLERKLREALMAILAERRYSKRQILENYLNEIYLGQNGAQGIFGVWEASRFYFRKEPSALSLAECALIAGLLTGPNHYSPHRQPERAKQRRDSVLRLMFDRGLVSDGELEAALAAPLGVSPPGSVGASTRAPYFVDYLRAELASTYPNEILTGEGLSIFTGLDPQMQAAAEEAVEGGLAELGRRHPRLAKADQPLQACLIALAPQTGEIKAMVGGRDYRQTQYNRCVQALRQPGSVFKPFVYVAALDRDGVFTPVSTIDDEPFTWEWEGRAWTPGNYRGQYHGRVSVREALEHSLNAATARVAREVGLERVRDVAQRMGIRSPLPLYPSLVLGAVEVTPLEVAEAYGVLANQGLRATPLAVRSVVARDGSVVERKPMHIDRAIPPEVAFLVTHVMEGVLDRGTGSGARELGFHRLAAGKTGTTNEARDAWFAGFTPDLLAVVWVGFDDNRPLALSGSQAALPIWTEFMKRATETQTERPFVPPPGVVLATIDPLSGALATSLCRARLEEAFLEGREPHEKCPLHPESPVSPAEAHFGTEGE